MRTTFVVLLMSPLAFAVEPPAGTLARGFRQYTPKADAFALGTLPYFRAEILPGAEAAHPADSFAIADTYELLFLARTRPVRLRVVVRTAGQSLPERYRAHLKELYAAFDRDGDGSLNRYEAELVFSRSELQQMLRGGFGFRGMAGTLATLDVLDRNADGRVSLDELAEYYQPETPLLTQTRAVAGEVRGPDDLTSELFTRLDANQDGRLSEQELKAAETILARLDADEDETVSGAELLANSTRPNLMAEPTGAVIMTPANSNRMPATPAELQAHLGPLPSDVCELVINRYDLDRDRQLTRKESDYPPSLFDSFDANRDGRLTAAELEAWRTGVPDVSVTLTVADKQADCTAVAVSHGSGVEVPKQTTPDRVVLRVGSQTIDVAAVPSQVSGGLQNPYANLFPANKPYLEDRDLVGPQYQFLRVAFDPADYDGNGKLTKAEFDRYFALQMKTTRLGLTLTHSVRLPNLFQLLDANSDGRLGVRELRTAYERLQPLEPSGEPQVTRKILQPSAVVQFGSTSAVMAATTAATRPTPTGPQTAGPIWFRKMDRNGDGDVSRTEFLGPKHDFDLLDADRDGLIALAEAEAYEKTARSKKE